MTGQQRLQQQWISHGQAQQTFEESTAYKKEYYYIEEYYNIDEEEHLDARAAKGIKAPDHQQHKNELNMSSHISLTGAGAQDVSQTRDEQTTTHDNAANYQ